MKCACYIPQFFAGRPPTPEEILLRQEPLDRVDFPSKPFVLDRTPSYVLVEGRNGHTARLTPVEARELGLVTG